ncbi:MAG: zf-HC2 domain-containing protein [Gemmatimonadota bacterium]
MNTFDDRGPGGDHPEEELLHDLLDGDLEPHTAAQLNRHLEVCVPCGQTFRELEELRERARSLSRDAAPTRDLWPGIVARLPGKTGVESQRVSRRRGPYEHRTGRPRPRFGRRGPAWGLATAAGLIAIVAGSIYLTDSREASGPDASGAESTARFASEVLQVEEAYRPAIEELEALVAARELAPETRAILEENLGVIERAIEESRAAVRADPQGRQALESLRRMYDAKVETLRTVAVRP